MQANEAPARTRVVCIGECMVELRSTAPDVFTRSYAGDAYNTAVYLKRSLPEARVQLLTCTGDDSMSQALRAAWQREGIEDAAAFTQRGGTPGLYLIETDIRGERSFHYWRSHSAARQWWAHLRESPDALLADADMVYFSGISLAILSDDDGRQALRLLQRLKGRVRLAFDPNVRLKLWRSSELAREVMLMAAKLADILLPSAEDAEFLVGTREPQEQLNEFRKLGAEHVALTLGAAGCLVLDQGSVTRIDDPRTPTVVDTSGAGDAFNAAYLAATLRGESPVAAANEGLELGARVVSHAGAVVPASISHGDSQTQGLPTFAS
jgi:2-dehydro-3-deoxygluconokinase